MLLELDGRLNELVDFVELAHLLKIIIDKYEIFV